MADHEETVRALVAASESATLSELQQPLKERGVIVSLSSIDRFLKRLRLSFKKDLCAAEQQRPDVAAARLAWSESRPSRKPGRRAFGDISAVLGQLPESLEDEWFDAAPRDPAEVQHFSLRVNAAKHPMELRYLRDVADDLGLDLEYTE